MGAERSELCAGKRKAIFPILLEGDVWVSFAAKQYADLRNGAMPPNSYFETVKKRLGKQVAQMAPEDVVWKLPQPSESGVWKPQALSDAQELKDRIVDHI